MVTVIKSSSIPPSLAIEKVKATGSYKLADVVSQISKDFNDKCYVCEEKDLTSINVEHFVPHRGNVDLKFDWENLFYCCYHCNNIKGAKREFDNILNCTIPSDDVLHRIKLKIEAMPYGNIEIQCLTDDITTANTALLLDQVYNGTTPLKRMDGVNLRKKIIREVNDFFTLLFKYEDDTNTVEQKGEYKDLIRRKLSANSPFTAFKVWAISDKPELLRDFSVFIPKANLT